MTIGERIKLRREELKLSQDELAKRLGYKSRSSINKIEVGSRDLTQSKIKAIADALETTPSYIMGWDEVDYLLGNDEMKKPAGVPDELWEELCKDEDKMRLAIWICQLSGEDLDRVEKLLDAALLSPPE